MILKVIQSIPPIVKVKKYSKDLEIACREFGLDPVRVISAGPSLIIITLPIFVLLSFILGIKIIIIGLFFVLFAIFLPEYPKILYKRKIVEHLEELPYIFSIFSSNYSITQNLEVSFKEIFKSFGDNKIIEKIKDKYFERYRKGTEKIELDESFEDIKDFFDYINISFSISKGKKEIVERGFEDFIKNFKRKKIEAIGKAHTKILLMFTFGNLLPIILLSAFPVMSIFLTGISKFLLPFLILLSSLLLNFVLVSSLKYEIRVIGEKIKSRGRFPKWVIVIPLILSPISLIYAFRFFGIILKLQILEAIGLNMIPFSIVLAYFLGIYLKDLKEIKKERKVRYENNKIPAISQSLKAYLSAGINLETALSKILKEENVNEKRINSKVLKWFINKVLEMREKSRSVIIRFCETVSKITDILNEYREELLKRTQNLSSMMKYTVIFVLPLISAIIIKASVMIFKSYQEAEAMLKEAEIVSIFPTLEVKVEETDIAIMNLLMFFYVISVGYLILDFSHYLTVGETPSKRLAVARDLFITSLIFLLGGLLVRMI